MDRLMPNTEHAYGSLDDWALLCDLQIELRAAIYPDEERREWFRKMCRTWRDNNRPHAKHYG